MTEVGRKRDFEAAKVEVAALKSVEADNILAAEAART